MVVTAGVNNSNNKARQTGWAIIVGTREARSSREAAVAKGNKRILGRNVPGTVRTVVTTNNTKDLLCL